MTILAHHVGDIDSFMGGIQSAQSQTASWLNKFDAYLLLAIHTRFADYDLGEGPKPLLDIGFCVAAESLSSSATQTALLALFATSPSSRLTGSLLNTSGLGGAFYLTAQVTLPLLLVLAVFPQTTEIQLCANMLPRRAVPRWRKGNVGISTIASPPKSNNQKLIAVIDHGCPFAHAQLREGAGTKVFAIWDQDSQPDFPHAQGKTPIGFGYGRQITKYELDTYMRSSTDSVTNLVDEDACYELAEYGALRYRFSHGALTLGLLAGNQVSPSLSSNGRSQPHPNPVDANLVDLVFVQLPRAVAAVPDRGSVERCILDGISYVVDCAGNNTKHIALMVDYGTELGPHDGSSWFERALESMVAVASSRGVTLDIVFPSGNSHEEKKHAVVYPIPPTKVKTASLGWWIPMGNDAPATLELWCEDSQSNFSLKVTPPASASHVIQFAGSTEIVESWPASPGADAVCVVVNKKIGSQIQLLIQLSPTLDWNAISPTAPPGIWKLDFEAAGSASCGPLHVYTAWGGKNHGFPKRVGKTILVGYDLNVSVQGNGSTLGSSFGDDCWVVGGFENWGDFDRAAYSSGGAGRGVKVLAGNITSKNIVAVTEQLPSLPGLLCMGNRNMVTVRARGTSFAPPQWARTLSWRYAKVIIYPPTYAKAPATYSGARIKNRIEYGEYRHFPPP